MKYLFLAAIAVSLVACESSAPAPSDKDKGGDTNTSAADKKDDKGGATKPAVDKNKGETKAFDQIPLRAQLPEMSSVSDAIGGKGVMIVGLAPVTIIEANKDSPKTVEAAKKDAADFKPDNFKDSKLDDGWVLTFENKGSMGTNYWLTVRRDIGGKAYICKTSVMKDSQRKAALDICKSLKHK